MARILSAALVLGLINLAAGHGYLKSLTVNGKSYPAWQVGTDNFLNPVPVRYARRLDNNGPVPDFTSKDIT